MPSSNGKKNKPRSIFQIQSSNFALSLSLISLFIILNDFLNWPILQFAKVVSQTKFRDTLWVLQDADCYQEIGSEIFNLQVITGCPAYIYGEPLLKILNLLHIGPEDTQNFVYGMRILFSLALAFLLSELFLNFKKTLLAVTLILLSPGVQLMLYNGNIDLLILSMIIGSYFAFKYNKSIIGFFLIALVGMFKFYTIPIFAIALLIPIKKRDKLIALILFLITAMSAFSDLQKMKESIPSTGYAQFGMIIFPKYLSEIGFEISPIQGLSISVMLFLITSLLCYRIMKFFANSLLAVDYKVQLTYLLLGVVFLTCFFTGLSYDSRLIYLTLCGIILLHWIPLKKYRNITLGILVGASIFSCGIELGLIPTSHQGYHPLRLVQLANDIAIEIMASLILLYLFKLPLVSQTIAQLKFTKRNSLESHNEY